MRILIFILLKITEIALIIFVPYGIGLIEQKIVEYEEKPTKCETWGTGIFIIILGIGGIFILLIISALIIANWNWAGKILR